MPIPIAILMPISIAILILMFMPIPMPIPMPIATLPVATLPVAYERFGPYGVAVYLDPPMGAMSAHELAELKGPYSDYTDDQVSIGR